MKERPGVQIQGIDINVPPDSLIPAREFDGRRIPFDDNSFDAALLIDVLHHADDPCSLLRECGRVSRGCVIVKDQVYNRWPEKLILSALDWMGNVPYGVPLKYHFVDRAGWDQRISSAGLERLRDDIYFGSCRLPFPPLTRWNVNVILTLAEKTTVKSSYVRPR